MSQPGTTRIEQSRSVRFDRPFCLFALLCVLLMPSTYKGGASTPHAHSFFQFWFTGEDRAFDHHHNSTGYADSDRHGHSPVSSAVDSSPNLVRQVTTTDQVAISPESAPGGTVSALVLMVGMLFAMAWPFVNQWRFPNLHWIVRDRRIVPEAPPPRAGHLMIEISFR